MNWSFSSLKMYKNCAKQYYEIRVAKNYVLKDSSHSIYGKEVHKAIQDYIEQGTPFPKNYVGVLANVPRIIELLPDRKIVEHEMAIDHDRQPCSFDSANYYARGIADLLAFDGDHAFVIDWKTGSDRYADTKQLTLMALLVFYNFPEVNTVDGMLYFTKNSHAVFSDSYERSDIDKMWDAFNKDLELLDLSFQAGNWPMKPSGLCGYCPVDTCPHYLER